MNKCIRLIVGIILIIVGCHQIFNAINEPNVKNKQSLEQSDSILIGDEVVNDEGVVFCVTNVANAKSIGEGYMKEQTENNFVLVTVKITNNSNEPYDVNSLNFTLIEGNKEYEHYGDALLALENVMFLDTINPSLSNKYIIVYETATTTEQSEYKLKIKDNVFKKTDNTYITLKEVS